MSLVELDKNARTDKNSDQGYLELYQELLISKKDTAKNVLEIGVCRGGSIKLWYDFFTNATVYGLDCADDICRDEIINDRIVLYTSIDAYDKNFFNQNFLDKNIKCDFMLDDGPHTLLSMIKFIHLYSQIMTDDGILIIEDVQDMSWITTLSYSVPENLKKFIQVFDLRHIRNQYDSIVFTINKTK